MVAQACDLSTWKVETKGQGIGGQSGLHRESLTQTKQNIGKIELDMVTGKEDQKFKD